MQFEEDWQTRSPYKDYCIFTKMVNEALLSEVPSREKRFLNKNIQCVFMLSLIICQTTIFFCFNKAFV